MRNVIFLLVLLTGCGSETGTGIPEATISQKQCSKLADFKGMKGLYVLDKCYLEPLDSSISGDVDGQLAEGI